MPIGLFQTQLLVHETALLIFGIAALWMFLKAFEQKLHIAWRIVCLALAGIFVTIGLKINTGGLIMLVSFCIISVVKIVGKKVTIKKLLHVGCVFLIVGLTFVLMSNILSSSVDNLINTADGSAYRNDKKVPYGWPIYLGMNYETSGVINKEDADTYQSYTAIEDPEEAKQYQINLIKDRANEYVQNPGRIPVHLFNKMKILWGEVWLPFAYEQGNEVEQFVLKGAGGILYKGMYLLNAIVNLVVMAMILFAFKPKGTEVDCENDPELHFKMVIIGVTTILLVYEISSKYTSYLQIFMYAIWMLRLKDFVCNSNSIQNKVAGLFKKHTL